MNAVVDNVIRENAEELISDQLNKEPTPAINRIEKEQQKYSEMVTMHEPAIKPERVDKQSFVELRRLVSSPNVTSRASTAANGQHLHFGQSNLY